MDWSDIPTKTPEEAWKLLATASDERDLFDFKEAVKMYIKALPGTTYKELEDAFRSSNLSVYLIAVEKEVIATSTIINLQGKMDCKYLVTYHFSPKARRESEKATWPATPEENLQRLEDAGHVANRGIPLCNNCEELGHISKNCPEEKRAPVGPEIRCVNCDELGHRSRDCGQDRKQEGGNDCRNCKKPGHKAADCTEPRSAEGVECKRCNEVGHFAKDCPNSTGGWGCRNCGKEGHKAADCTEDKNMDLVTCRNCEKTGHYSKDCPLPKDWSKVTCNNCGQKGHTIRRCKEPIKEAEGAGSAETADGSWGEPSGGAATALGGSGEDAW
ncbi:MAG: hypothetical protein M1840_009157 [Geoglossum simile]|nr:MAG: hypothetical protein M1840_009157 [Geoglossum simile]